MHILSSITLTTPWDRGSKARRRTRYLSGHEVIYHDRSLMVAPRISVIIPSILQVLHGCSVYVAMDARDVYNSSSHRKHHKIVILNQDIATGCIRSLGGQSIIYSVRSLMIIPHIFTIIPSIVNQYLGLPGLGSKSDPKWKLSIQTAVQPEARMWTTTPKRRRTRQQ